MPLSAAFQARNTAVVTGAASGIGLAAARRWAQMGMRVALLDLPGERLEAASALGPGVRAYPLDVSDPAAAAEVAAQVAAELGVPSVVFANAGVQPGSATFGPMETWRRILDVNFWGAVNIVNAFSPAMIEAAAPAEILVTGSKQGITTPPGDPAYNASKAALKAFTEALEHDLRNRPGARVRARLVIPGFVWTPLTYGGRSEKPAGAWTPEQTVDFVMASLERDDFYILCPDNDVSRALDEKRIAWAAGDIINNRPPLSRWHKDYAEAFAASLKA
jgi:NAD(P)-dependent dehydrogenase (short-subunit alcohol dehydrogenase family)